MGFHRQPYDKEFSTITRTSTLTTTFPAPFGSSFSPGTATAFVTATITTITAVATSSPFSPLLHLHTSTSSFLDGFSPKSRNSPTVQRNSPEKQTVNSLDFCHISSNSNGSPSVRPNASSVPSTQITLEPVLDYYCDLCLANCSYKRCKCNSLRDYYLCLSCFTREGLELRSTSLDFSYLEDDERNFEVLEYHCNHYFSNCTDEHYRCNKFLDYHFRLACFKNEEFGLGLTPKDYIIVKTMDGDFLLHEHVNKEAAHDDEDDRYQETVTKLMTQRSEKGFELALKTTNNRVLQEQLQQKCAENQELQDKVLLLQQQLLSMKSDGPSVSPEQIVSSEVDELERKLQFQCAENKTLQEKLLVLQQELASLISDVPSGPVFSTEIDELKTKSQYQEEEEEKVGNKWEKRVALVLCNHDNGALFKAFEEGLKSKSMEMAKSCLVTATWLTLMLSSLPETEVKLIASQCLLNQFIEVIQSSRNLEENALVTLALKSFIGDPDTFKALGPYAKCIYKTWRKLKGCSLVVADTLKAIMNLPYVGSIELWSCTKLFEIEEINHKLIDMVLEVSDDDADIVVAGALRGWGGHRHQVSLHCSRSQP